MIKMPNPNQEKPASLKDPNQELMDMDSLCIFKINYKGNTLEQESIKVQGSYPNHITIANPKQELQGSL